VLVLSAVATALGVILVPTLRTGPAAVTLASVVLATIASTLLGARARARFAFARSFAAEAAGGAVLIFAAVGVITGMYRGALGARTALVIEALALAVTATVLFPRPARSIATTSDAARPAPKAVFANIYTVGALVLLDVVLFRRVEVYFLERSPDGLTGVAVLGLSLQIAAVALLVPTALLEAWQPRFAMLASGSDRFVQRGVVRRGRLFARMMVAVTAIGVLVPVVAVPFLFPAYRAWLGYIVAFVAIRLACAAAGFHSSVLYAVGGHRALFVPGTIAVAVALGANAALTPRFGLRGALLAYAMTQVTLALLTVAVFRRVTVRAQDVRQRDAVAA
jgi:O-antigen/teichoic acid export membrane protein